MQIKKLALAFGAILTAGIYSSGAFSTNLAAADSGRIGIVADGNNSSRTVLAHTNPRSATLRISVSWPEVIDDSAMKGTSALLTVAMVGDVMTGTTYPTERLPENGGRDLFSSVKDILRRADLAVGNLEGAICEGGTCTKKVAAGRSYAFRMPPVHASLLSDAGFDFMSIANNHSNDFGPYGSSSSMQLLDNEGIAYAGLPQHESAVVERDGTRFGLCAFGHNAHTLKHRDTLAVKRIISSLSESCDIVIVSFHGGAEGKDHAHLPEGPETYLGEDRGDLRAFARLCIDCGADIVYGHGPHVTRAVEVYKDRFIAYSLGNFCTPFGVNLDGINGHAPVIEVGIARDGTFVRGMIHGFIQEYGIGPQPDIFGRSVRQIRMLTASDIKDSPIGISEDGSLYNSNITAKEKSSTP